MTEKQSSVKREARRLAFIRVAADLFLEKGFAATSVNEIVRRAGGSLTTLYDLFPTKEALFQSILAEITVALFAPLSHLKPGDSVDDVLRAVGHRYIKVLSHPKVVALYRVVVAEAHRLPQLRAAFLCNGVAKGAEALRGYLEAQCAAGTLSVDDLDLAVGQFLGLLRGPWHIQAACGEPLKLGIEKRTAMVERAVQMFMGFYGEKQVAPAVSNI
jgi:TetR/AcrR family transcriptional repressor of cmeABC operon